MALEMVFLNMNKTWKLQPEWKFLALQNNFFQLELSMIV